MTDHDKLRQLAENATRGPWDYCDESRPSDYDAMVYTENEPEQVGIGMSNADAQFIAAANPDTILALLDEIDSLRRGQGRAPNN